MKQVERQALLRVSPERFASSGLDWGNPKHYEAITIGAREAAMWIADRLLSTQSEAERAWLLVKARRVYTRAFVAEMAFVRDFRRQSGVIGEKDMLCRLSLEKMADCLEEGLEVLSGKQDSVYVAEWLGMAIHFANVVKSKQALEDYVQGPFGGLAGLASVLSHEGVATCEDDLPALVDLVQKARKVPVGVLVTSSGPECRAFQVALTATTGRLVAGYGNEVGSGRTL